MTKPAKILIPLLSIVLIPVVIALILMVRNEYLTIRNVKIELDRQSLPESVLGVSYTSGTDWIRALCVQVDQSLIWKPGENAELVEIRITGNLKLFVDGKLISRHAYLSDYLTIFAHYDEERRMIGSSGGQLDLCYNIDSYASGRHEARVIVPSNTETDSTFVFSFIIE